MPRKTNLFVLTITLFLLSVLPASPTFAVKPPARPTTEIEFHGSAVFPGDFYDVLYHDGYLYLADGRQSHSGNLKVLDLSDLSSPQVVATDAFPGDTVYRLSAQGDLLSVAIHGYGMVLYDISNPPNLQRVGEMQTDDIINDVVFHGDLLYVFGQTEGLTIIDYTNPGDLQIISDGVIPNGNNYAGAVSDNEIVAIPTGSRIYFYDVSTPELPVELSYLSLEQRNFYEVVADGNLLYAGTRSTFMNSGGVAVIDASDSENIHIIAQRTPFGADFPPNVGIVIDGDLLFYAAGQTGLVTYDITDPADPTQISMFGEGLPYPPDVGTWQTRVAAGDGHVFTIMPDRQDWYTYNNLWVLDNSDPSEPVIIGEYDTPDYTSHVAGVGDYAFVASEHDGVYSVDISDPAQPEVIDSIAFSQLPYAGRQILYEDDYLYVNGGGLSFAIIDVTDPTSFDMIVQNMTNMHRYTGLDKQGDLLAVTAWDASPMPPGWMEIWDISTPENPQQISFYELGMRTEAIAIQDNFAYVAYLNGIGVVNIDNPAQPELITEYNTGILALDIVVRDDIAWFCDSMWNLYCLNIEQPTVPVLISQVPLPDKAVDLVLQGDSLYVATQSTVYLVDVSDPTDFVLLDTVPIDGITQGIAVVDDRMLLSDKYGFHVYTTGTNDAISLAGTLPNGFQISTYPNPFNSSGSVQIILPRQTYLTVDLFNTLGQRTLSLYNGSVNAGTLSIPLDASGLSSGVFFVRATAGDGNSAVQRVVMIK